MRFHIDQVVPVIAMQQDGWGTRLGMRVFHPYNPIYEQGRQLVAIYFEHVTIQKRHEVLLESWQGGGTAIGFEGVTSKGHTVYNQYPTADTAPGNANDYLFRHTPEYCGEREKFDEYTPYEYKSLAAYVRMCMRAKFLHEEAINKEGTDRALHELFIREMSAHLEKICLQYEEQFDKVIKAVPTVKDTTPIPGWWTVTIE